MKHQASYSSDDLVAMILNEPSEEEKAIAYIFRNNKAQSLRILQSLGASLDMADDILQESMLVLIRQIKQGKFLAKSSVHTYFIGICKRLLLAEKRKKRPLQSLADTHDTKVEFTPVDEMEKQEEQMRLHKCMQQLGNVCQQILLLRSQSPAVPWEELALEFGFKNAQNAMNKGGKCMKKLRQLFFTFG